MKYCLILILCFTSVCAAQTPAGPPTSAPYDLKGYIAELDRWTNEAEHLKDHPENAAALRKSLPAAWQVNLRGQSFTVPTTWLYKTLDSLSANHSYASEYSAEMLHRLAVMRAEAEAFDQPAALKSGQARARLDEILRRREFRGVQGPTWFEILQARIQEWILEILERIFGGVGRHPILGEFLLWLAVGAVVLLLMISLIRYFTKAGDDKSLNLEAGVAAPTWKDWGRDALGAAGRGDYREAIRLAYWAGILRMEDLGAWQMDRARTHREYLRLLSADDVHRSPLARMTAQFELIWYGGNPASARDFQAIIENLEALGCNLRWHPATANS